MTIFGWDASHFDGVLDLATLKRAKAEGVDFLTHKVGEGLTNVDPTQTALAVARDAGITVLGGYWFCHGEDDPAAEARRCVAVADQYEPWWRDWPAWFWQVDAETETGHQLPTEAWIDAFADELVALSGRVVVVYASRGQYGDRLTGLSYRLWNADYGSNPHLPFKQAYPGDAGRGWTPYSGQTPLFWQFGSNTTIAGLSTCDANAYRGSLDELHALISGGAMATQVDLTPEAVAAVRDAILKAPISTVTPPAQGATAYDVEQALRLLVPRSDYLANKGVPAILTAVAAVAKIDAAIQSAVATIQAAVTAAGQGGTPLDTQAIVAAIAKVGEQESAIVTALHAQLVEAAQASAAALAADPPAGS